MDRAAVKRVGKVSVAGSILAILPYLAPYLAQAAMDALVEKSRLEARIESAERRLEALEHARKYLHGDPTVAESQAERRP